jgi:hypothetical protein
VLGRKALTVSDFLTLARCRFTEVHENAEENLLSFSVQDIDMFLFFGRPATINTPPRLFPEVFVQVEVRRFQRPSEDSCFLLRKLVLKELVSMLWVIILLQNLDARCSICGMWEDDLLKVSFYCIVSVLSPLRYKGP